MTAIAERAPFIQIPPEPAEALNLGRLRAEKAFFLRDHHEKLQIIAQGKFALSQDANGGFGLCPRDVLKCDGIPRVWLTTADMRDNGVPMDGPWLVCIMAGSSGSPQPGCRCYADCQDRNRKARFVKAMKDLGIGSNFWNINMDAMKSRLKLAVRQYLDNAESYVEAGIGMVLQGTVGVGKTAAMYYVASELRARGYGVMVSDMRTVMAQITSTPPDNSAFLPQVLCLDEIEKGWSSAQWTLDQFLALVNHRYEQRLPTLCTSNVRLAAAAQSDPRLVPVIDRWMQNEADCKRMIWVEQGGPSARIQATAAEYERRGM